MALALFETDRANKREELGKELGDCFDDWYVLLRLYDVFFKLACLVVSR